MDTEKLIEEVRNYRFLYDRGHVDYKNIDKKMEKWREIGLTLNSDGDSVKNKWRNLRDCYMKYKRLEKGTTGTAACTKYKKWPWGNHLQFLDDSLVRPSTKSNVPSQNPTSETGAVEASPPNIPAPSGSSVSVTQAHQLPSSQMPPPQKRMRNSKDQSDDVQQLIKYFNSKNTSKRQPDEIDHLFMSYAATFKRFSSRRQTKLKMELANLFGKAELEEMDESYSNSSCSTRRCSLDLKIEN